MNEKNLLASLAVFRELYNKETDIWSIIASFLNDLIIQNQLKTFTISQISILFNETFEFNIPSSVIKSSLNKLSYLSKSQNSYIVNEDIEKEKIVLKDKALIEHSHSSIFSSLTAFVEKEKKKKLTQSEEKKLQHNFCNFLLDESNGEEYIEYITSFIVDNENNEDFVKKINVIREGVILHSGLKYTNEFTDFNDFGNWRKELVIFLDTEIIFHLMGYNGEIYKDIAHDFLKFTKEINSKSAQKKYIKLQYFPEVKSEIEGFFTKAKHIFERNESLNPRVTAMVDILKDVKSQSDLLNKKSDLFTFLSRNGIEENSITIDVTKSENYEFNIISQEVIQEVNTSLGIDNCESILETFNKISILRRNSNEENFENVRYILLSGNSKTLRAAFNTSINERFRIPLATNLNFIINRFWFKLNKGFSQKDFPSSFNIITKSQIILSKILNENIGEKYDELQLKFKNGEITKEQATNRIKDLRVSAKKPEEIKREITREVLDFITLDSLEDYIEKQSHYKEKSKKFDSLNIELEEKKKHSIQLKEQLIQSKKELVNEKKQIINNYNFAKVNADNSSIKYVKYIRTILVMLIILFYGLLIAAIFYYGWDDMEKYTFMLGIPSIVILLCAKILKKQIGLENLIDWFKLKVFNNHMLKNSKYSEIEFQNANDDIQKLEKEIENLESQ